MDKERVVIFLADFDDQINIIRAGYDRLKKRASGLSQREITPEIVESTGYWLHNLYCAYEDLFKIVAGFWENNVSSDSMWHKRLLKRMRINIEGVRPALISEDSFNHLNELRSFRHVFRHAYSYGLDDERVFFIVKRVLKQESALSSDMERFRNYIYKVIMEYEKNPD
jgi:hypothetical protein